MSWHNLNAVGLNSIKEVKEQFHQAIQNVAAVGRHFLEKSDEDENAVLHWVPDQRRLAGKWIEGDSKFRSSISFDEGAIHLVDESLNSISSFGVNGKTQSQIMIWLEEQIGKLGLSVSELSLNLPYEIPKYPTSQGEAFEISDLALAKEFSNYYHNAHQLLSKMTDRFSEVSEVTLWPHHFDIAILATIKNSGNPETSTYVGLGMSPGDDHYDEPYFYVNSWPYAEENQLSPLEMGNWHTTNWIGAVLMIKDLWGNGNQETAVEKFYNDAAGQLEKILLK